MKYEFKFIGIIFFLFLTSCTCCTRGYEDFYGHLQTFQTPCCPMQEDENFLIILVDACHLDYSDACEFFQSVAIHPNGSKKGDVGHTWIYLQGKYKGQPFVLEGGHSGEREEFPARYFDGIMNYNDWGYANPTAEQMLCPRYEPDPIKYLWTMREDGFFQKGSGGHRPTFAAKISLSSQQFEEIIGFIRPSRYPYRYYGLLGPQCCTFVAQVASLAGLSLQTQITMHVSPRVYFGRTWIHLWKDCRYSTLTFSTPDRLEKSLMQAVNNGEAEYALDWYLENILKEKL
jgi:hypothetical protein